MSETIKVTARKLRKAGFSVVLIDSKTRKPYGTWKKYQKEIIAEEELNKRLDKYDPDAVQIICGAVSGLKPGYGLLVLDFDDPSFFKAWVKIIGKSTVMKFPIDKTGRGGYHVYLRCPDVVRKQVLAFKPDMAEKSGRKGTIEYLGEGCSSIVSPSLHKNGSTYTHVPGSATAVPFISGEETAVLITAARSLDQAPLSIQDITRLQKEKKGNRPPSNDKSSTDVIGRWNKEHAIEDVLEQYGYRKHPRFEGKMIRPEGENPTVQIYDGQSYHFNSNDVLSDNKLHDSFDVFCFFEHNGDLTEAIKDAAERLGIPYKPMEQRQREVKREVMRQILPGYTGEDDEEDKSNGDGASAHFKVLGYHKKSMFYLPRRLQQVVELSAASHTSTQLLMLADLMWWEKTYQTNLGRKSIDWDSAANALFASCASAGPFNPDVVRGCGAWTDNKRIVVHEGNRLIVDRVPVAIPDFSTSYIYERRGGLQMWDGKPMGISEANKLMRLCERFVWEKKVNARLFAGWIFLANMCGALRWRPHIWVTGEAGSGKTTVVYGLIKKLLGRACLGVQASTSEAGIRQRLKHDAFPIIFDEIDTQTLRDQDRVKGLLELARQSSSDTEGGLLKGSTSGDAIEYKIRSMFCFASVKTHIEQAADASRISVLNMLKPTRDYNDANWKETQRIIAEVTHPDWSPRFRSRSISLISNVLINIETFAEALSHMFSTRIGDQLGSLLAGAYNGYYSDGLISHDDARRWVESQDWSQQSVVNNDADDDMCLKTILESKLIVSTDTARLERTVEELIMAAGDSYNVMNDKLGVSQKNADITLLRHGIKYDEEQKVVWFSNSHNGIKNILRGSPWPVHWNDLLRRTKGAIESDTVRYHRVNHRAVGIPIDVLFACSDETA
jgi:hypothetical protein